MEDIKEILAANIKENRRKKGLTQEKLAEMANISLNYLAILELARKFPSGEMLERLAEVLEIEPHEFFLVNSTPQNELEKLRQEIKDDINNAFGERLEKAITDVIQRCKV
ncbi:MAG: helix-turn-helix transcriptional regulator [Treponema sp.]|jgi:transcriptional regulator with XRE-family HTH domain|nr:helix-turn-helix transcriptional regulator [Treponema sp.]